MTGRGCSDKGSEDIFEEDCETFQSKERVSIRKQAEAEVVPSSSSVEVEVEVHRCTVDAT